MLSEFVAMAVHVVPLALNSMRLDTPVTVSLRVSSARLLGNVSPTPGTATLLTLEGGAAAVALILIITVLAASPNTLRGTLDALMGVQAPPSFRLSSIVFDTPVIVSDMPTYNAIGAAARAGVVTVSTAEANVVSVALTRT
jgi:hypothetical protein